MAGPVATPGREAVPAHAVPASAGHRCHLSNRSHQYAYKRRYVLVQALSFCGRQYVSPSVPATPPLLPAAQAGAMAQDDDSSDSDVDEAATTPAPYVSAMRRTEAAAANRAQVRI